MPIAFRPLLQLPPRLVYCLLVLFACSRAIAQCPGQWLSYGGVPGTDGDVYAVVSLPDGGLVVGGLFTTAGSTNANNIARWDGSHWYAMGDGMDAIVYALALMPNGDVVAGGRFQTAGGVQVGHVARWNGTGWSAMGNGLQETSSDLINALAVLPNGDLIAGGQIVQVNGVPAGGVARWNGATWIASGGGTSGRVNALLAQPDNSVIVGGNFITAGGVTVNHIARWDGTTWTRLHQNAGQTGVWEEVNTLAQGANGLILVGTTSNSPSTVMAWTGTEWHYITNSYNQGPSGDTFALRTLPNGDILAGGEDGLNRWNGTNWVQQIPGVNPVTRAISLGFDNEVYFGGGGVFQGLLDSGARGVARLTGSTSSRLGRGSDGQVFTSLLTSNGDLVVGGSFHGIGDVGAKSIARLSNGQWRPLSAGLSDLSLYTSPVYALAELANGDLIAGGTFTTAGSVPALNIARWDGSQWWPLGPGLGGSESFVKALAVLPNGDLIAGGRFQTAGQTTVHNVARWDGAAWTPIGAGLGGTFDWVSSFLQLPGGDLIAGGHFRLGAVPGYTVARWTGTSWVPLQYGTPGSDYEGISALALAPDGGIIAAGDPVQTAAGPSCITEWNGSSWDPLEMCIPGHIHCLSVLPDGQLLAGGAFRFNPAANYTTLATWDGVHWTGFPRAPSGGLVNTIAQIAGGELIAGGSFTHLGSNIGVNVARWKPGSPDFNGDGTPGTDADILDFFSCLAGNCCPTCGSTDFNADGNLGTDADIEAFFRVLAGGPC